MWRLRRHVRNVPTRDSCTAAKRLNSITPFLRKKEGSINLSGFDFPTTLSFRLSSTLSEQKKQTDAQRDFNFQCNRNGRNDLLLRRFMRGWNGSLGSSPGFRGQK
jgi:hypothetical protein